MSQWNRFHILFILLGLLGLVVLTYATMTGNAFMVDDFHFLEHKYQYTFHSFTDFFTKTQSSHYSPFYFLYYTALFNVIKDPFVFHLIGLAQFYLNTALLFWLILLLTQNRGLAFLTAALFCGHPIHSTAVQLIGNNFILIAAGLLQGALIAYWQRRLILSLLLFTAALLYFEGAVLFPLYLAAVLYFFRRPSLKALLRECGPFLLLSLAYLVLWGIVSARNTGFIEKAASLSLNLSEYTASMFVLIKWYLANLFYPADIVWIKNIQPVRNAVWIYNAGFIGAAALIVWALKSWGRQKAFALTWFLLGFAILPVACLGHAYMGLVIEPHWFYFSSMGVFFLLALGLTNLKTRINPKIWTIFCVMIVGYCISATWAYNIVNKTEKSYCEFWLKSSPDNTIALMALGKIHAEAQEYPEALMYYERILKTSSYDPHVVHTNIGLVFASTGNLSEARKHIKKAILLSPRYANNFNVLGTIFSKEGNFVEAEGNFQRALELDPYLTTAAINLADLYGANNKKDQAAGLLENALTRPLSVIEERVVLTKLAVLYAEQNNEEQLRRILKIAEERDTDGGHKLMIECGLDSLKQSPH